MDYHVQLFRGIIHPKISAYQLQKAEQISALVKKMMLLFFSSLLLFALSAYFGIGNESISKTINNWSAEEFEARKLWFALGQVVWGVIWTGFILFFPALLYWILTDLEYRKLLVLQLFAGVILLLEKLVLLPFQYQLGIDVQSSPFSLGVLAQYITNNRFLIGFFGAITLFKVGIMFLQYHYLKILTDRTSKQLIFIILSINLFFWIFTAILSMIPLDKLI
ncbi:hypothetical protein ACE38V_11330 [Cytobacillus sp. Hz8]|uniref:hypothetical protein n=1 Tax=Cytobacillus sp. Hz8 TaxID=3347168 RepID=UPI0035DB128F